MSAPITALDQTAKAAREPHMGDLVSGVVNINSQLDKTFLRLRHVVSTLDGRNHETDESESKPVPDEGYVKNILRETNETHALIATI